MKKKLIFGLAASAVLLLAVGAAVFLLAAEGSRTRGDTVNEAANIEPKDALEAVRDLWRSGSIQPAYTAAVAAFAVEDTRDDLAHEAGLLAMALGKPDLARAHMQAAWDLGRKNLAVLLVVINALEVSDEERIAHFERMHAEIEQTPANVNAKGRFYSRMGRDQAALRVWRSQFATAPSEALALQIARKLEMMGRREEAIGFLADLAPHSVLGLGGYNLWVSLLIFDNKFAQADAVARSAAVQDPHREWALKLAMLALTQGRLREAEEEMAALATAASDHPVALTVAHEARIHAALLQAILGEETVTFDAFKAIASAELAKFPVRLVTTPVLGLSAEPKQLEGERFLYDFLAMAAREELPSAALFARLESILGDSPGITWLGLRQGVTSGRVFEAVAIYDGLDSLHPLARVEGLAGMFFKSPVFVTEAARALALAGRSQEAFLLVNHLHDRGLFAPTSIQLFASLARATGRSDDLSAMQEALGRQFAHDVGIQLASANEAVRAGRTKDALELVIPLVEKNRDNVDLRMLELMLLLDQGETDLVLVKCAESGLPERNQHLVRARVALRLADPVTAESHFQRALDPADFFAYLDYARFLVDQARLPEASRLYGEVLDRQPENLVALQGQAVIDELAGESAQAIWGLRKILLLNPDDPYTLTRLAKLNLQTDQPRDALTAASKVLARQPDNPDAFYLQITAMIQLAVAQPADSLTQRKLHAIAERMNEWHLRHPETTHFYLSILLAAAFRDSGAAEEARAIYADLLALDPVRWEGSTLSRADVELALEALRE